MNKISINQQTCPANHYCPVINICPVGAVEQENPYSTPVVNEEKCLVCGRCIRLFPYGSFELNQN